MSELPSIEEKAVELIEKFEALAVDVAPDAIELGLATARVSAAAGLIQGIVALGIGILGGFIMYRMAKWELKRDGDCIISCLVSAIPVLVTVFGFVQIVNVWSWVGIFYPELWIAKQVLGW